jgi:alpha-tubulin suppressor-like RCC1 family protein
MLQDGEIVCWGANRNGQLGTGNSLDAFTPTTVVGLDTGG